jgi:hypothetical protein
MISTMSRELNAGVRGPPFYLELGLMTGALWLITTRGPLRFLPNQFSNRTLQNSRELIANLPFGNLRTKLGFRMKQSRQRSVRSTCQSLATGVESQVTSR